MNELLKQLLAALQTSNVELNEEQQKAIQNVFQNEIGGFVNKEKESLEKNKNKILDDYKKLKTKFGDETEFEKLKKMAELFEANEEMQLIAEGKHEEVFQNRMAKQKTQWETALTNKENELTEIMKQVESLKADKQKMVVKSKIEDFARTNKLFKQDDQGALDLFKLLVEKDWSLNDEGELAFKDADRVLNKSGKPFTFEDYVDEDIKPTYGSSFFVAGEGVGVKPNNNNPHANVQSNLKGNLGNLSPEQRDALSDEEWLAMRESK